MTNQIQPMNIDLDMVLDILRNHNLVEAKDSGELLRLIIEQHLMTSGEVMDHLGISRQMLHKLKMQGHLKEIKRGLFSRYNVELIRSKQIKVEWMPKYAPYPVYRDIQDSLIIDARRLTECEDKVSSDINKEKNYMPSSDLYKNALESLLNSVVNNYKQNKKVYLLQHEDYENVFDQDDLDNAISNSRWVVKEYTKNGFVDFLKRTINSKRGLVLADNFTETLNVLEEML